MSIKAEWDNPEKTIIRYTVYRPWTIAEFFAGFPKAARMIRAEQTHVIGIIIDDSRQIIPPPGAMMAFRQALPKGRLPIVLVKGSFVSRAMLETLQNLFTHTRPLFYAETLDDARYLLYTLAAVENVDRLTDDIGEDGSRPW